MSRRIIVIIVILFLGLSYVVGKGIIVKKYSNSHKLKAGQVWKYKNRPGEDGSIIRILKIERNNKVGTVVHISVENLKMTNADDKSVNFSSIDHMVFDRKSIEDSVTELVKESDKLPDFQKNYDAWKESFEQGMAGIFDVPVADALSILEEIMN